LYLNEIKFLSKNKRPDVILCIIPEKLIRFITENNQTFVEDEELKTNRELEDEETESEFEQNFRSYLKAKSLSFDIPIQIIRDRIAKPTSEMQDASTIAWNLFTAIYYKASGTPWGLVKNPNEIVCYAGVSFYKSRDKKTTQTSVAQIFNELGKGVILRGEPIQLNKEDRSPHLTERQAFDLMDKALKEYQEAVKIIPQRLVIHKTSNFNEAEISGFTSAAKSIHKVNSVDLVTIQEGTSFRIYRENVYPPLRGTLCNFDEKNFLLYTRGAVRWFETYSGRYVPSPIEIKLYRTDESPDKLCKEILALTKMNWNNAQFDRKFPITVECARNVGAILKYLNDDERMQLKYSFYM
jgi:hypothetical protein